MLQPPTVLGSMRTAVVSLLPNAGKDSSQMDNFHPLSLLNGDHKVLVKILVMHLEKVISSLIHLDQVGFITGCHAACNMRRVFHVMSEAASLQRPADRVVLPVSHPSKVWLWSSMHTMD